MNSVRKVLILALVIIAVAGMSSIAFACGDPCGPGTGTPGYWKRHPEAWPVSVITVGGVEYTMAEAIELMNAPVRRDKSLTMFKAVVAARLNILIGNCSWCITDCLMEADTWLADNPPGSEVRGRSEEWQYSHGELLYWCLDEYNNGLACAPSRDALE